MAGLIRPSSSPRLPRELEDIEHNNTLDQRQAELAAARAARAVRKAERALRLAARAAKKTAKKKKAAPRKRAASRPRRMVVVPLPRGEAR